jgi:hypothetical protein
MAQTAIAAQIGLERAAARRRLGVIGAVIAVAVIFAGPMATIGAVGRIREAGFGWDTDMSLLPELGVEGVPMIRFMAQVVWRNLVSITVFAGLVAAALLLRRNPDTHKRLIVIASIAIVGPLLRASRAGRCSAARTARSFLPFCSRYSSQ